MQLPHYRGEPKETSATTEMILEILNRNLPGPDPSLDGFDVVPDARWLAIEDADEDGHRCRLWKILATKPR